MFYEAVAADNTRSISMAVSKDGVRDWQRLGRPILEAGQPGSWDAGGVCSPSVVSMAGERIQGTHARHDCPAQGLPATATAAESAACMPYSASKHVFVLERLPYGFQSMHSGPKGLEPCLVRSTCHCIACSVVTLCIAEGRWRLYYAGLGQVGAPAQGIGLAMTDKEDMTEFEGVRVAFRRRV